MKAYTVYTFYKFAPLSDVRELQEPLRVLCERENLVGTILLAEEGINATVGGSQAGLDALMEHLRSDPRLGDIPVKRSESEARPFYRMKVRLKKEIVTLGVPGTRPAEKVGHYVEPEDWNGLIQEPGVVVLDTRNRFEVEVGSFEGADHPDTTSFREFPAYVEQHPDTFRDKKIAMFCTGGIRCEKATSYLLDQGFTDVFHLKGGILNYLEKVPKEESLWHGECFVFDNRVTVNHDLEEGEFEQCRACRRPLSPADLESPDYEEGVSCPACIHETTETKKAGARERQRQVEIAGARGRAHLGSTAMGERTRNDE